MMKPIVLIITRASITHPCSSNHGTKKTSLGRRLGSPKFFLMKPKSCSNFGMPGDSIVMHGTRKPLYMNTSDHFGEYIFLSYASPPQWSIPCADFTTQQGEYIYMRRSNDKGFPVSSSNLTAKAEIKILKAFDAIHGLSIVHGNIWTANILIAKEGNAVWIIDFEFAEIVAEGKCEIHSQEMEEVKRLLMGIRNHDD